MYGDSFMKKMSVIIIVLIACIANSFADVDCSKILNEQIYDEQSYANLSDECIENFKYIIVKGKDTEQKLKALKILRKSKVGKNCGFFKDILLSVNSMTVQQMIIEIISEIHDKQVLPIILPYLESPFYAVREAVIMALKKNGDDRMYPHIIKLAKSDDAINRIYALEALYHLYDNRFYEIVVQLLKDQNKSVRYFALECVKHNEIIATLPYIRAMAINDDNDEVKVEAILVLASLHDKGAYYIFVRSLGGYSDGVREAAVDALIQFPSRDSALYLSRQLVTEDETYIKRKIVKALITFRTSGDIRGLQKILENDDNPSLRIYAAYAFGIIKDERAITLLIKAMSDDDYRVRAEAGNALGNFKGKIVVIALLEKYEKESSTYVKTAILYSLKKICDKGSLQRLFSLYCNENDVIHKMILQQTIHHIIARSFNQY